MIDFRKIRGKFRDSRKYIYNCVSGYTGGINAGEEVLEYIDAGIEISSIILIFRVNLILIVSSLKVLLLKSTFSQAAARSSPYLYAL